MFFLDNTILPIAGFETEYKAFYAFYDDDMSALWTKQFAGEAMHGTDCTYFKIAQYVAVFYLAILIKKDIAWGLTSTELIAKYNLTDARRSLSCNGINIDDVFAVGIFNIDITTND